MLSGISSSFADLPWDAIAFGTISILAIAVIVLVEARRRRKLTVVHPDPLHPSNQPIPRRAPTGRQCLAYFGLGMLIGPPGYGLFLVLEWFAGLRFTTMLAMLAGLGLALAAAVAWKRTTAGSPDSQWPDVVGMEVTNDEPDADGDGYGTGESWSAPGQPSVEARRDSVRWCRCGRMVTRRDLVCPVCDRVPYRAELTLVMLGAAASLALVLWLFGVPGSATP